MNNERRQVGKQLKKARIKANLKQEAVGRYLQIPTSAVSALESGCRKLDAVELYQLAKLYQRPMEWFFNEMEELSPSPSQEVCNREVFRQAAFSPETLAWLSDRVETTIH